MTNTNTITTPADSMGRIWQKSPGTWKAAAVIALVGFVLKLGGSTTRTINGVADCDGYDVAPFITAAVVAGLTVVGWRAVAGRHEALRPATRTTLILVGLLLALAAVHLVRGLVDPAGSFC